MGYGKRIGILLLGFGASGFVMCLLAGLCVPASSAPREEDILLELPCLVEGSQIRLLRLTGFEGGFLEDTSLEEVSDVAALVLENTGAGFADAYIHLETTTGPMEFQAFTIPPHSRLLVLEKQKAPLGTSQILSIDARVTKRSAQACEVSVTPEGLGTLKLENTTDHTIGDITVYHKSFDPQADLYMGGITHQTKVELLLPGETVYLHPAFYADGGSKVVCITENALS